MEPSSWHPCVEHGYYEKPGVRSFAVDKDKRVIAKIIGHFAATRCLELGCATGPVLKLLCEARIDAQDVEVSHLALALASPLIRKRTADSFSVGRS